MVLSGIDRCVRVPDGGRLVAVLLPRRGTVSKQDRKVNEGSVVE